jgi:hypothetical protein
MMPLTPSNKATPSSLLECPSTPRAQKSVLSIDVGSLPPLPFLFKNPVEGLGSSSLVREFKPRPAYNRNTFTRLPAYDSSESSETNGQAVLTEDTLSQIKNFDPSKLQAVIFGCLGDCNMPYPKAA